MPFKLRSDIRFPRKGIGTHVACPIWEPWRKIFGGGDSERWLSSLWVRTESTPWCTGHTALLKMLWFGWVTKTMLFISCGHCRSQNALSVLPRHSPCSPCQTYHWAILLKEIPSPVSLAVMLFTSCHQQACTLHFHWASATSLHSTPQILLGLMQWFMHEGLILQSCWVKAPVLTYCFVLYLARFQD